MNVEIEVRLDFVEMYKQVSSLRFIETSLRPLVPIFAAYKRLLAKLSTLDHSLRSSDKIKERVADDFVSLLDNYDAQLQALEQNVLFLLGRVSSIIQMASTRAQYIHTPCPLTNSGPKASDTIALKSQNTTEDMSNHMLSDSAAIRVITIVTLFYLPSSFVSVSRGLKTTQIPSFDGANC